MIAFIVVAVVVFVVVTFANGGQLPDPPRIMDDPDPLTDGYTDDEIHGAALKIIKKDGEPDNCSFLRGSVEQYERCTQRIAELRAKYEQHPSRRMRKNLVGWLNYYATRNEEGWKEWQSWKRREELARKATS